MSHRFKLGSQVMVCAGDHQGRSGTVTKIVPDPKNQGRDMIVVQINADEEKVVTLWTYPSDLREVDH